MSNPIPLEHGNFYHIYNRGVNGEELFRENKNYEYFLQLYDKYIDLIADTFAWALLNNHFHLLVRIKEEEEIEYLPPKLLNPDRSGDPVRFKEDVDPSGSLRPDGVLYTKKKPNPEKQFGHLFNAYAKAYNKSHNRHGSLFERPFKRKLVNNPGYFKELVLYIHNNPKYHGFAESSLDYPWTSYLTCVSFKPTSLQREKVIGWFDNLANFKYLHYEKGDTGRIKSLLFE